MSFSLVDKNEKVTNTYKYFCVCQKDGIKFTQGNMTLKYTIPMLRALRISPYIC